MLGVSLSSLPKELVDISNEREQMMIDDITPKKAITFGRYSPITVAHISKIDKILNDWPHLVLGILDNQQATVSNSLVNSSMHLFYKMCDNNWTVNRTVFTADERVSMASAAITEAGLTNKVCVVPIDRPEYSPNDFGQKFPKTHFDLVFPAMQDEDSHFDRERNQAFEAILQRPIKTVQPKIVMHLSDALSKDPISWETLIPKGALDVFLSINGPDRLKHRQQA